MKIGIICNGRSGSTSLFYYINSCLTNEKKKYKLFFEPFNYVNPDRDDKIKKIDSFYNQENVLLKTFIDENNYPYESFKNNEDYWDWFFKYFNKIIVLEREDKRLQAESLYYHIKLSKNRTVTPYWHKPKFYDLNVEDEKHIVEITKHLEFESKRLKNISDMGYLLITYEDIFIRKNFKKINDYLGIGLCKKCEDEWINSPFKKVRLEKKINGLI